jgi:hypothetical protein
VNGEGTGSQGCKVPKKTRESLLNNNSREESKEPLRLRVNFERSLKTGRSAQRPFAEARGEAASVWYQSVEKLLLFL